MGIKELPGARDFAPGLLAIQEAPPRSLPRAVIYTVGTLFLLLVLWACFGRLDIIASAQGRLVPQSYVKIVQPAEAGIVQAILVTEGQHVTAGQVLMRMDAQDSIADQRTIETQREIRALQLRRIDAELNGKPFYKLPAEPQDLFGKVLAQYSDRKQAHADQLGQAEDVAQKAEHDYNSALATRNKLQQLTPLLKDEADSYREMGQGGYVPRMVVDEKQRDYLEKAEELKTQEWMIQSLRSAQAAAQKQINEVNSKYRSELQNERMEAEGDIRKLDQQMVKQQHHGDLLELRATQAGIVKDLVTHTVGTVVQPGTVLLSIVPENEPLIAEVTIRNDDVAFVYPKQAVKLKLMPYPFEQYGLVDGSVLNVGPDSNVGDGNQRDTDRRKEGSATDDAGQTGYRALISLNDQKLVARGQSFQLVPGMQVVAEINQGSRSVLEYVLSPVQRTLHDSGHER